MLVIAEGEAAETVPLGLVLPLGTVREGGRRMGFHRAVALIDGQTHGAYRTRLYVLA